MGSKHEIESISDDKKLGRCKVIEFILFKFQRGAKVFNGDWWGGSKEPLLASPHGFDVNVLNCGSGQNFLVATYGLKETERGVEIDLETSLMEPFVLGFSIEVVNSFDCAGDHWTYKVLDNNGAMMIKGGQFKAELEACRDSVFRLQQSANFNVLKGCFYG